MTTNNDNMVRDKINNKYTEINNDKNSNDVNNYQKEDVNEEEAVTQIVKKEESMYNNFLDYDRRVKEGEFLLNQYFNNPKLTTLCKYLWFNCTATCIYLCRYRTISNLLNENKRNKIFLIIKHIIYIAYAVIKMLLVSFTLFTMRLAISTIKLIFYIFELLSSLFTCLFFPKEIELILKKFRKKLESSSNNKKNNKNDTKVNRYWINLKDYWRYVFAKITGKVNTSKKIIRPTLNLALLKRKKISFIKKILIIARHWTKLKVFNLRLINIVDNNKNKIRKRNAKNQLKYVKKVLDDYRKGRKTKKSKIKIKGKKKNNLRNIIVKINNAKKLQNIKDKLIQKITELATKTKKLEFLGEKILFNTLFVKITKSLAQEKDLQTNLTKSQKAQYDRYSKAEEEKKNIKENEIKNKENTKENQKEKENNPKNKINEKSEMKNPKIKENIKIENLKSVKSENEKKINKAKDLFYKNENKKIQNISQEIDKNNINDKNKKELIDCWQGETTKISTELLNNTNIDDLWEYVNNIKFDQPTQTSQMNDNSMDNNGNFWQNVKTSNSSTESNDPNNKGSVKKTPSKNTGGHSL